MIAVNIYPPSTTSTMDTFAIFARHIHRPSHPAAESREDPFNNLHVNRDPGINNVRSASSILSGKSKIGEKPSRSLSSKRRSFHLERTQHTHITRFGFIYIVKFAEYESMCILIATLYKVE
ncbi:hypothetical protein P5V15_004018 [Pogonomyrmex californicus]